MTLFLLTLTLWAYAEEPESQPTPPTPPVIQTVPAPVVQIRAAKDQRFSVIIGGQPVGVASHESPLTLTDLTPGSHPVELRTENNLIIWVRGTLHLESGEELVLSISEGRMVEVTGRTGAWRPATSSTTLPRKPARQPDSKAE